MLEYKISNPSELSRLKSEEDYKEREEVLLEYNKAKFAPYDKSKVDEIISVDKPRKCNNPSCKFFTTGYTLRCEYCSKKMFREMLKKEDKSQVKPLKKRKPVYDKTKKIVYFLCKFGGKLFWKMVEKVID